MYVIFSAHFQSHRDSPWIPVRSWNSQRGSTWCCVEDRAFQQKLSMEKNVGTISSDQQHGRAGSIADCILVLTGFLAYWLSMIKINCRITTAWDSDSCGETAQALMGHGDRKVLEDWVAAAIGGALPSQEGRFLRFKFPQGNWNDSGIFGSKTRTGIWDLGGYIDRDQTWHFWILLLFFLFNKVATHLLEMFYPCGILVKITCLMLRKTVLLNLSGDSCVNLNERTFQKRIYPNSTGRVCWWTGVEYPLRWPSWQSTSQAHRMEDVDETLGFWVKKRRLIPYSD